MTIPDIKNIGWNTACTECVINAPCQLVWDVLTDFGNYDVWNSFTYDVEKDHFAVGEEFTFKVNMAQWFQHTQRERIVRIEPPHTLAWSFPYDQNPWLNATRYQVIKPVDGNCTHYQTWETFTGILTPLLKISVFDMVQNGFEVCASNLKNHCETRA